MQFDSYFGQVDSTSPEYKLGLFHGSIQRGIDTAIPRGIYDPFVLGIEQKGGVVNKKGLDYTQPEIVEGIHSIPGTVPQGPQGSRDPYITNTEELFAYYGWVDVRSICDAHTELENRTICIYSVTDTKVGRTDDSDGWIIRSDGYEGSSSRPPVWDASKDLIDNFGTPYRWVLYNTENWYYYDRQERLYAYLDFTSVKRQWWFYGNAELLMFDLSDRCADFIAQLDTVKSFCSTSPALLKLPDNFRTTNWTKFVGFCYGCHSIRYLPDNLDTSKAVDLTNFAAECSTLLELPENLDVSNAIYMAGFASTCYNLTHLPPNLYTPKVTDIRYFCEQNFVLTELPDGIILDNVTLAHCFCWQCYSLTRIPELNVSKIDPIKTTLFLAECSNLPRSLLYKYQGQIAENPTT